MRCTLEKAKPCPFCGSDQLDISVKNKHADWHTKVAAQITIYCKDCHAAGPRYLYYTDDGTKPYHININQELIDKVVEQWNNRRYDFTY